MSRETLVTLKEQMSAGQIVAPFIYDCLSGRMAENTGFETMIVGVSSLAMAFGGVPDVGILTADDIIDATARIADFLPWPVIAEFGDGFGETPYLVWRNVRRLTKAAAAAVIIDDSDGPHGTSNGLSDIFHEAADGTGALEEVAHPVVAADVFSAKIRAAVDACQHTGTLVIAATNAKYDYGLDEAIARLRRCVELGADIALCRGLGGIAECRSVAAGVPGPKMYGELSSIGGKPVVTVEELADLDFGIVSVRYMERAALYGLMDYGLRTKADGSLVYVDDHDFEGHLPSMDHHRWLFLEWEEPWEDVDAQPAAVGNDGARA